jgi:hypothetical protein
MRPKEESSHEDLRTRAEPKRASIMKVAPLAMRQQVRGVELATRCSNGEATGGRGCSGSQVSLRWDGLLQMISECFDAGMLGWPMSDVRRGGGCCRLAGTALPI